MNLFPPIFPPLHLQILIEQSELFRLFVDGIVGQMNEGILEAVISIHFRRKSSKTLKHSEIQKRKKKTKITFVVDVDTKREKARHSNVDSQVKLQSVDEKRIINVP